MTTKRKQDRTPGYDRKFPGLPIGTRVRVTFPDGRTLDTRTRSEAFYSPPVVEVAEHSECVPMAWVKPL